MSTRPSRNHLNNSGAAVAWFNARDGRKEPKAQHYGEPLRSGSKYVAVQWVRASPYDFDSAMSHGVCDEDPGHCDALRALRAATRDES